MGCFRFVEIYFAVTTNLDIFKAGFIAFLWNET